MMVLRRDPFLVSTWPTEEDFFSRYESNGLAGRAFTSLGVAVPSRLYFKKSKERPLDGVRIAIKDMYHLNGLRTSVCNRAYYDLYPAQTETAESVRLLTSLGAIVVGKTHLSSFAWKEEPTECVEYPAPFNPRGDGYQSPAGSSSGSGAAIASYEWLDFTLGTDNGKRLEVEGDPLFGMVASLLDLLKANCLAKMRVFDEFVDELAAYLGVKPEKVSIADTWEQSPPVEEKSMLKYMENVQEHGFFYELYHCFDGFREDYERKYRREPFLTMPLKWVWSIARLIDESQKVRAWERYAVYKDWFIRHILRPDEARSIVVLPIEQLEPRYRDVPPEQPVETPKGISVLYLSPTLGAPEIVVPAGQIPFNSRITGQKEYLPMAVSLLGAPETDLELIEMTERFLKHVKRSTRVQTGRTMFGDKKR
ncbi:hypothetical protein J4E91_008597 [Alternaria rosae]|nr:hypothetical protein J4E91_008597 [Alternaria rosae]